MLKQDKLKTAIELELAIKQGKESFILLKKLDEIEAKIDGIKPTDLSELDTQIKSVKENILNIKIPDKVDLSSLEKEINLLKNKIDEPVEIELTII